MTASQQFAQLLGATNSSLAYLPEGRMKESAQEAYNFVLMPPVLQEPQVRFSKLLEEKNFQLPKLSFKVEHIELSNVQPDNIRIPAVKSTGKDIG